MKLIVLVANIYSERGLGLVVSLCEAGYKPAACLSVSTLNLKNVIGKMAQHGPKTFIKNTAKRLRPAKPTEGSEQGGALENIYVENRLKEAGQSFSNIAEACKHYEIPLQFTKDINSEEALTILREYSPDLLVYAGGGILRQPIIEIPRLGVINAHSGILPEYRGMNVSEWALLNGDKLGITTHFIDAGIDTGRILFVDELPISVKDTSISELRHRCGDATIDSLLKAVQMLDKGEIAQSVEPVEECKQYFAMHQKLVEIAEKKFQARRPKHE